MRLIACQRERRLPRPLNVNIFRLSDGHVGGESPWWSLVIGAGAEAITGLSLTYPHNLKNSPIRHCSPWNSGLLVRAHSARLVS